MPVSNAHALQHVDQILGSHAAGGTPWRRAAAQAGDGGLVVPHAELQRRQGVGQGLAVGVVEMAGDIVDAEMLGRGLYGALAP